MLIDVHTHVFPEKIADRALGNLVNGMRDNYKNYHVFFKPRANGTVDSLFVSMEQSGCTHSVICPVVTNEKSTAHTNEFSMAQKSERIIPFASLMPSQNNYEQILEGIAEQGFKGIKLHPEFQNFYIDDERSIEIIKRAERLNLVVIIHAGKDPGYPPPVHSTPDRIARLLYKIDGSKIIAAHLGGWKEWEDVERFLSKSPIFFDTACISDFIEPEYCKHLMRNHGIDKILFGSDFPWQTSGDTLEFINSLGLTEEEHEKICYKNAAKLLL